MKYDLYQNTYLTTAHFQINLRKSISALIYLVSKPEIYIFIYIYIYYLSYFNFRE